MKIIYIKKNEKISRSLFFCFLQYETHKTHEFLYIKIDQPKQNKDVKYIKMVIAKKDYNDKNKKRFNFI